MRIFVKNKVVTLRGSSYAVDETGANIFKIKGKFFTFTRKKFIMDMNGSRLFTVRTRFLNFFFHKAFIIDSNGKKIVSLRNKFAVRNTFKLDPLNGDDLTINGDFLSWNMTIFRNGVPIGDIHRNFNIIRDSFILDADPENLAFLTAMVIAIDNVIDSASNSHT